MLLREDDDQWRPFWDTDVTSATTLEAGVTTHSGGSRYEKACFSRPRRHPRRRVLVTVVAFVRDSPALSSCYSVCRSRRGGRELSRDGRLPQVVTPHAEKTKRRELSLSASSVNPWVGGNSANKKGSPNATLFGTMLSFGNGVSR